MLSQSSKNVEFYLAAGTPNGAGQLKTTGITLTPITPLSISPSVGSPAGTVITALIKGVGVNSASVTLIKSDGLSVCSKIEIPSYGVVKCTTSAASLAATTLKVKIGTQIFPCGTASSCSYQTSSTMPAVTSVAISGS